MPDHGDGLQLVVELMVPPLPGGASELEDEPVVVGEVDPRVQAPQGDVVGVESDPDPEVGHGVRPGPEGAVGGEDAGVGDVPVGVNEPEGDGEGGGHEEGPHDEGVGPPAAPGGEDGEGEGQVAGDGDQVEEGRVDGQLGRQAVPPAEVGRTPTDGRGALAMGGVEQV